MEEDGGREGKYTYMQLNNTLICVISLCVISFLS